MPKMLFFANLSKKSHVEDLYQDFVEFSCSSRSWAKKQLSQQEKEQTFKSTVAGYRTRGSKTDSWLNCEVAFC